MANPPIYPIAIAVMLLIGLAVGVYGLTQAILQVPMGLLSDFWGRKKVMGNKQPEDTVTPRNGGPPENKYRSMPRLSSVPKVSNNMREL